MADLTIAASGQGPSIQASWVRAEAAQASLQVQAAPSSPPPEAPMPDTGPGQGFDKATSDAILVKIALEGLDFEEARKRVLKEAALWQGTPAASPSDPPSAQTAKGAPGATGTVDTLELSAASVTRLHAELASGDTRITVDATRVEAVAVRAVQTRNPEVARIIAQATHAQDPLVVDLTGEGPATTGADGAQAFDLGGDGDRTATSFVTGGTAFLALDRDGDGTIDSGKELFGDQHGAADGYAELARFDANGDGRIDAADPVWGDLRLLDGAGGQRSMADAGLASLSLATRTTDQITTGGDQAFARSTATTLDGRQLNTWALNLNRFDATV